MGQIDRQWLEDLWAAYAAHVYAYAARRVGAQQADDVVADVFTVAWRRSRECPRKELPWLYGIARRVLSDHYRTERRRFRLIERAGREPSRNAPFDEGVAASMDLAAVLSELRDSDREALLLIAWEGLEPSEAAAVVGMAAPAFRMRLSRARRRLRMAMESNDSTGHVARATKDGGANAE